MDAHTALNSVYVIDGQKMEATPASMLEECGEKFRSGIRRKSVPEAGVIRDEKLDRTAECTGYDRRDIAAYVAEIKKLTDNQSRPFELHFPGRHSRQRIAKALLDAIWCGGHFRLEDLRLSLRWDWDSSRMGYMAAFYASAAAAADYIYDLNCVLEKADFRDTPGSVCRLECSVNVCSGDDADTAAGEAAVKCSEPADMVRICPEKIDGDESDWIIYIPFDTCKFRLGASLLASVRGDNGDLAPETRDPDWFIDCYEVVRELVEDGVAVSGVTVCDGGLQAALERICDGGSFNISGISSSYGENDTVRILFSEVPGVLVRVRDSDYDYIDSQMLLQDIAYYPLGHPSRDGEISVTDHSPDGIGRILDALLGQATEGED